MAAKTKKRPLSAATRNAQQVSAESYLRFNPQRASLRESLDAARSERSRAYGAADTGAEGVKIAAQRASGQLRSVYAPELERSQASSAAANQAVAGLPDSAATFKGAIGAEGEGALRRLRETLANAQAETIARQTEAEGGRVYARGAADAAYGSEAAKLRERARQLDSEQGAFESGRIDALTAADRKISHDIASQKRTQTFQASQQEDQQSFTAEQNAVKRAAAEKKARAKSKKDAHVDPKTQGALEDAVAQARAAVKPYASRLDRKALEALFTNGAPAAAEKTRVNPEKLAALLDQGVEPSVARLRATEVVQKAKSAVPKIGPLSLRVALDLETQGYLSPETKAELHKRKYQAIPLGPTRAPVRGATPAAPGVGGQGIRPT